MIDCRRSRRNEHCWNHIIFIISMVYIRASSASSLEIESNHINCSQLQTCTTCTNNNECSWSLVQQICAPSKKNKGGLIVNNKDYCTQFSVVKNPSVMNDYSGYYVSVRISNDSNDFTSLLSKSHITCELEDHILSATLINDLIICNPFYLSNAFLQSRRRIFFAPISVLFDNKRIKFDNDMDNYYSIYDHDCGNHEYENCVTCTWYNNDHRYYLRKCQKSNPCTGSVEILDKRDVNNFKVSFAEYNVHEKCPEIKIHSVEPAYGLWTGGTVVRITVKNHEILAENKTIVATVAGRPCAYPVTVNNETITCTITTSTVEWVGEGTVKVVYGLQRNITVTSTQTFRFVRPSVLNVSPVCGPAEGGTILYLTGEYLDANGYAVRVSTGENVTCENIEVARNRILCRTGPSRGPAVDRIKVEYDERLWAYVANASFVYSGDPVLDAGQPFAGIVSGGTAVPVRGKHFSCLKNVSFYVDPDGSRRSAGCRVVNDTYMVCRTPALVDQLVGRPAVPLNFGLQVRFMGDVMDLPPRPDHSGFTLYPDPVFVDFEIHNRTAVVVNGQSIDRGLRADDVTVRFTNHTGGCVVTQITRDRVVCVYTSPDVALGDLAEIAVTVGDSLTYNVQRLSVQQRSHYEFLKFNVLNAAMAVVILILIIVSVGFVLCRLKTNSQKYTVEYNNTNLSPTTELQCIQRK